MKIVNILFLVLVATLIAPKSNYAQGGNTCAAAAPFCTGTTYQYDNNINTSSQSGPNYGCLSTTPNPSWYWMQIGTAGNIDIAIKQTTGPNGTGTGIDVDFIMWGPFTSATGSCGNLTGSNDVDCSYSAAATETANITGAVVGQYYLLLLTNYSNQNGYVTFAQSGGSGATNCSVVSGCTATVNNAGPFCAGNSITMSTSGQANATNYTWTGPNSFSQSGAALTSISIPNATPAMAGTYTLTITRSPGTPCVLTTAVVVNSTTATFSSPSTTQCLTGNSFNFTHTGTAGATHTWNFGGATANTSTAANPTGITYAAAGTYVVTHVATANGCARTETMSVVVNPMPALTGVPANASCGSNNGSIVINNTSAAGQGPFSFTNNGTAVGSQTITGLAPGTYNIGITNTFGCTVTTPVTVGTNAGPTNITLTPSNATCGLSNGSFTFASPVGGTGPYTYAFNNGAFTATSPINGLAAGTYSITVRDVNGCLFTKTVVVASGTGPSAIAGTSVPAGCGLTNGTYNVTGVTGGTAAYTFSVDGVSTGSLTSNLAPGTHNITVVDGVGCSFNTTFVIGSTTGPTSATINSTNASCGIANGTSTISAVVGGGGSNQFSFDGGPFTTGTTGSGLTAGPHTITIRDVNSCTVTIPYNVLNNGSPNATIVGSTAALCNGASNGSFTVSASGGSGGPFTYTLTSPFQTNSTGIFNGLAASIYTVIARDNAGCTTTATVSISQPAAITLTPTAIAARCFATATGTINVVGGGGTPAYTYNLNGGAYQASSSFNSVGAAIYNMGIRDANGCTATQTVQVTQPTALVLNTSSQNANCTAANGIATTTVSGGTGPTYTYTWTGNGGAGATSNGVVSGNYNVTVTDANGCTIVGAVNIGNTPGGTAIITASTNITCNGANNGNLTASMTGGTPNFTYNWSPSGQTTAVASNLAPGTHTCTITDAFGCVSSVSATLLQPTVLSAIMNSNNVKCFGTPTGTVSAAGTGGTFPYTYSWPGLASTFATVPNVAAANYTCIITDANNCSITQSITVTQPTSITLTSTVTPATCNLSNGSATVTASGGTGGPAYTYSWSTSSTSVISSVSAGTYTVEVKDANNCIVTLATTIPNNSGPSISSVSFTNAGCFGASTGVATAFATGGAPTYTYNWSGGQTAPTASNLLAGVHTVTVTDANGCVASASVTISQPLPLTVNVTPINPKCFGATNGGATAIALGGTPSYTYAWTDGGTSSTSNPLGAGVWGLTVTDAKGCVVISTMTLTNPPQMFASITSTNVSCFNASNGVAVGTTTNSFGAVNYYWTGGPSAITGQTVTSLNAGTYTLLATDQNSCTAGAQVIITQPTQITANITSSGSVTCNGGTDGFAVVTAGGGTPTYTYTWSGAASASGNSSSASSLPAGIYSVTVLDAKGCSVTTQTTILQPTPLATTLTTTNPLCNGNNDGTANIAYSGGAGTTHFLWEPGLQSGPGANSVNSLSAGSQTVTITSNGSCPTILTFTLTQPAALTAIVTASNSNCGQSNGRVCATVGGGTGGLSVLWSNNVNTLCNNNIPAGAYNLVVTDANGCTINASGLINDIAGPSVSVISSTNVKCFGGNDGTAIASITAGTGPYTIFWTGGATTQTVTNFNNGIKNITVTDAANCIGTASVSITEPPALASAVTSFSNVTCNGLSNGSAVMAVNFGTPNYNYTWTPSGQTSAVLVNVAAGTYTCNVLDANGCATSKQVTISQPAPLVMTNSLVTNITCNGLNNGQISTTILGGTPGYTYTWVPAQAGNSGVIGSLAAGPHNLTVTDSKTCSISANFNITEPPVLTSNFTSLPARCEVANGSASVTVNGGTPGYNISWNTNPVISGSVAVNLGPGSGWSCVITDSKGCSITQTVNVNNAPSPLITGYNVTQPTCFGLQNGSIVINYTSGTPSYSVTWPSPISQTQVTSSLSQTVVSIGAGVYTPTVTDSYGCVASVPVGVAQPSKLVIAPVINSKICYGSSTQIFATGTNGTAPYTYTWSPGTFSGAGPHTVTPTLTTVYNVAVSDANGCTATPTVITVNVSPQLTVDGYSVVACDKSSVTLVPNITSVGNGAPYDFIWSNGVTHLGASTSSITVAANYTNSPNTYSLTVKDNCTLPDGNAVFTVSVNPLPIISFTAPAVGCAPLSFSLTATSNGANDVFTWRDTINTIGTGPVLNHVYQDAGKYNILLSVVSANGCESKLTKLDYIEVYPQPVASFYAVPPLATILDPNFDFVNTSQGATSYYWDFGDPAAQNGSNTSTITNPSHSYSYVGEYKVNLVAISNKGCRDIASQLVEITPDFAVYIPNTFTPDGNGINDMFQPVGVGIDEENYRMDIFDRWGENIFTSNSFRKGWDGTVKGGSKMATQGVYVYKLMVVDTRGNKHPFVGHVTVVKKDN